MPSIIADRIKQARVNAGLTQKDLASRLHVGQSACANWEKGIREPDVNTICDICQVLGVTADYLLGLVTESGTVSAGERERLEARVTELERQLHDAEVSIATLREVILQGNAAPSSSPYSSSRPVSAPRRKAGTP